MNSRCDEPPELGLEGLEVQRDDRTRAGGREAGDEAVTDLAAGAGDENDGFAHGLMLVLPNPG